MFTGLAAIGYASISLKAERGRNRRRWKAQAVTADFFPVLGTAPLMGRTFTADNEVEQAPGWRSSATACGSGGSAARPTCSAGRCGQQADFEILGVMPPSFAIRSAPPESDRSVAAERVPARGTRARQRLLLPPPGHRPASRRSSIEQAQAQMDQITAGLAAETPRWFEDRVATVEPLRDYFTRGVRTWMLMLLGAVGFVLLIACVNLANLMLARASARGRELVIRVGARARRAGISRAACSWRASCSSLGGAALGLSSPALGIEALRAAIPPEVPRVAAIAIDLRVLAATVLAAVASGLLFGAAPLVQVGARQPDAVTRTDTASRMHMAAGGAGRRRSRVRARPARRIGLVPRELRPRRQRRLASIPAMS